MKIEVFYSVIIPTYNRADKIKRTIESVLSQTHRFFELIIVDDGSKDNTEEVVRSVPDKRVHYYKVPNGERAAARNFGIKKAKGDYVTFLDSDDIYYPHYLFEASSALFNYNFPVFFHLGYEIVNEITGRSISIDYLKNDDYKMFIKGNPLSCMGVFIKREVTNQFLFTEDRLLSGTEDWEFWLRMSANFGIKVKNKISSALIQHEDRSVLSYDHYKLYKRKELAMQYSFADKKVKEKFGPYYKQLDSYSDSYTALHLAMSTNKKYAYKYFISSVKKHPISLFSRRSLAIIRELIFN